MAPDSMKNLGYRDLEKDQSAAEKQVEGVSKSRNE